MRLLLVCASAVCLAACATDTTTQLSAERDFRNSKTTTDTNEAGEDVICRTKAQTGSRLRKTKRCATQAEWDAFDEEVQRRMKDMTNARQQPRS